MKNEGSHQNERANYESNIFGLQPKWPEETILASRKPLELDFITCLERESSFPQTCFGWNMKSMQALVIHWALQNCDGCKLL